MAIPNENNDAFWKAALEGCINEQNPLAVGCQGKVEVHGSCQFYYPALLIRYCNHVAYFQLNRAPFASGACRHTAAMYIVRNLGVEHHGR